MVAKLKSVTETSTLIEPITVTRLLVVSFFIAVSLGLVQGADFKLLATPFLPEDTAIYAMHAMVLALSVMVLANVFRRRAALVLALMVFWSSYITLFAGGDVSAFWRDLALIGGLIMSATDAQNTNTDNEDTAQDPMMDVVSMAPERTDTTDQSDDLAYREDFNLARSV